MVKTGTDDQLAEVVNYGNLDMPAVMRQARRHNPAQASDSYVSESFDKTYDIPAFLRKQAD
jgi:hypothetical protein